MSAGLRLAVILLALSLLAAIAIVGCAGIGAKHAPLSTVPDSLDAESKGEAYESMTAAYPKDAELYFTLGNSYYDQAIPDMAEQNFLKAIALDPNMTKARVNLAMLLAESGEADSAKTMLGEVLKREPKNSKALVDLGMIYYNAKDIDTAVKYYSKALAIDPRNAEAHYDLGLAFAETGVLLEAIREFRAVLDIESEGDTAQRARLALERAEGAIAK
jgi:tetratricopeptide (TPR) repeat protein